MVIIALFLNFVYMKKAHCRTAQKKNYTEKRKCRYTELTYAFLRCYTGRVKNAQKEKEDMKRTSALIVIILILFSAHAEYVFTDASGAEVTLSEKPSRVAVLFSSFAEVWRLSGGDIDITVREAVDRAFAGEDCILVDGGAGKSIDLEALVRAEPDFVIGSMDVPAQVKCADFLKENGMPAALFRVESAEDYADMLKVFTDITGNYEAYRIYGESVLSEVNEIRRMCEDFNGDKKRILFIRSGSGVSSAKAKNADQHFAASMLSEMGAYNIADNATVLLDGLSFEEILTENPDAIFISTMGDEESAKAYMESVLSQKTWQALSAVKNGRVYYLPKDLFQFKPNHRWAEAYRLLMECLYPEMSADDGK